MSVFTEQSIDKSEHRIRAHVRKLAEFYRHLAVYIIVISALWLWTFVIDPNMFSRRAITWWVLWPTFGWGIGVFFHALSVFPKFGVFGTEWEERKVNEIIARERERA